jgi:hypothetical protein
VTGPAGPWSCDPSRLLYFVDNQVAVTLLIGPYCYHEFLGDEWSRGSAPLCLCCEVYEDSCNFVASGAVVGPPTRTRMLRALTALNPYL